MDSDARNRCSHLLGFPIRISPDHSLLAASRGFSQLTASFIAYLRLGIHTHALSSLTIKSTSHTRPTSLFPPLAIPGRVLAGAPCRRYFFALTCVRSRPTPVCVLVCPSIFKCQRSIVPEELRSPQSLTDYLLLTSSFIWWAWVELNYRPHPYQGCALAN
jgi:hypothetical protein